MEYSKTLWERLDNHRCSNKDEAAVTYSLPYLTARVGRESRSNFISILDKGRVG